MNTQKSEHHFTAKQLLSEKDEIIQAKKDLKHFNVLYDRYYVRIFQYIYQRVKTESQAADITSETFIKAMENIASYKFMGVPFASWLFRIARNEVYLQHKKSERLRQINFSTENIIDIAEELDSSNENKIDVVIEAIKKLTPDETDLIEMKYFEKRSYSEIGQILNITENNSKVKTFRVIQKIKQFIQS